MKRCQDCKYGDFPPPGAIMGLPDGAGYCKRDGKTKHYLDPACPHFDGKYSSIGSGSDDSDGCFGTIFGILVVIFVVCKILGLF